jgi:cytochrome c-type biogenesis protein CcmH/NrfG
MRSHATLRSCAVLFALTVAAGCSRGPRISGETYAESVAAFHVSLAAMQTSQDVLARQHLERLTQLVPEEPAGWANLGLLLLRQQQTDEAIPHIARASELAPRNAAIQRLLALAQTQKGDTDAAIRHWRRGIELDPADVKGPFALAQELERQGGPANEAEAQQILGSLVDRSGNLAARLEYARLAAKRGDARGLSAALDALRQAAGSWPPEAQTRLAAVRQAAANAPANATTPVIFLKNVLIRSPQYRAAYAALTTPLSAMGEPLVQFVALENPVPHPAPPDDRLTFSIDAVPAVPSTGVTWASAVWLTGDGNPIVIAADRREVRLPNGAALPFPSGPASTSMPGTYSVTAADLNYDMRSDLVFAGDGGLRIFRQDPAGGFTDITGAAKTPADVARGPLSGAWAADVDTDGDLDVIVARPSGPVSVLRNNGDGTVLAQSPFTAAARVRGFVWADVDGEGVPDAVLLDETGTVRTFLNLRGGEFRERSVPASFAGLAAIASAEVTGDAVLDAIGVRADGAVIRLSQAPDGPLWQTSEIARVALPPDFFTGGGRLLVADVDNNGAADLIVSNGSAARVLLAGPDATFTQLAAPLQMSVLAAADLDGDGRLDLIGTADGGARVARSQGAKSYHWQAIRPRAATATGDQRINSFGIGGEVEVRTGLHAQKQVISSPSVHFGLGQATRAEVARIIWPNGVLQSEFDLAADAAISASQRLKGSCPWLFAWNGREMGFVTDFIWRSPLGLRINAQATADVLMTEEWVKLRGEQLAARGGVYDLRVTAELWETHFFDHLSLLVVDHPEGTEIFVDERFAVPPPALTVHATSPVREFAAARDDQGRDVAGVVRARDDRHLDFAGRGVYQGVTRPHYVEVELPADAPRVGRLLLVGQGWIHPTDSSVNVALSQGTHPAPNGLSLEVADAGGRFRQVRGGLGFPAGKDKTVLIDLTGLFPPSGARKLRLQTNLEIFWDRLGWAVERPDVGLEPRRIELKSADLRYRGYSVTGQKDASTPERPRYLLEGTAPRWRDLEGFHTRFGDVRELLLTVDDRYVIMNAGDEMVLTFPEAPPPAAGMVRDFVVVGDGWEKDGDYNTTASRTVLPLPTHRSAAYKQGTGRLEDDPVYRQQQADFERYHTRYVSPAAVREALRTRR